MGKTRRPFKIDDIRAVMFDLDGTIYCGSKVIPGANDTIGFFREHDVSVFFTTNNSTKTRRQIHKRLVGMGIDWRLEEVLTSGYLAGLYALRNDLSDVYVFGSSNLENELEDMGVSVSRDESASNLLVGYDPEMSYEGLAAAVRVALNADCLMACNRERVYPGEGGVLLPGCGAMTAPIEWCSGREFDVVIGKPSTLMAEIVSDELSVSPREILVVGDTYESDVLMARRASCRTILITDVRRTDVRTVHSVADLPYLLALSQMEK